MCRVRNQIGNRNSNRRSSLCRDDPEALLLLREVTTNPHGGDRKSDNVIKSDIVTLDDRGNSKAYSLDKLKRDRPDLYQLEELIASQAKDKQLLTLKQNTVPPILAERLDVPINDYQRSVMALKLEELIALQAKAKQGERTDLKPNIVPILAQCYTPRTDYQHSVKVLELDDTLKAQANRE